MTTNDAYAPAVQSDGSYRFHAPVWAFEKASAPEGQHRRIGGLITTDTRDRQNEVVLQDGLDFSQFLTNGYWNDNHAKDVAGIVGVPDPASLRFIKKGQTMPNGEKAPANGHWAEGWMFEDEPRADAIWKKALAIQKLPTKRRLGFSIEGGILRRAGHDGKIIAKAVVKHVALTHMPVNTDTTLDVIAKSLVSFGDFVGAEKDEKETAAERAAETGTFLGNDSVRAGRPDADAPVDLARVQAASALGTITEDAERVTMDGVLDMDLGAGRVEVVPDFRTPAANSVSVAAANAMSDPAKKALTAASPSGRAIVPQSLEHSAKPMSGRTLTKSEAISHVLARYPQISLATAGRVVDTIVAMKRGGILGDLHG